MENEVVDMEKDPFKEYLRESEPNKAHKGYNSIFFKSTEPD